MSNIDEIKKLKKLLDDGIITEADFKKQKKKLLGIENDDGKVVEPSKTGKKSLDDYESELIKEAEEELENQDNDNTTDEDKKSKINEDDIYKAEKAKERARLDAEREAKKAKNEETNQTLGKVGNSTMKVIKWILAVLLWLLGIACVCTAFSSGWVYIPLGVIFILQGLMACPKITEYTQNKFSTYTKHKAIIIIITIIIWVIFVCISPSK